MRGRGGITFILITALAVMVLSSVLLQRRILQRTRERREIYHDWLYLPSSDYAKVVTLGYDQFAADFLWLRAIQTFGATYAHKENMEQLKGYFDVIADLDPRFMQVYTFGNLVIGEEAGDFPRGLAILEKGMLNNPRTYRMPFEAAFFSYWSMNEADRAKYYVRMALKKGDCPDYVSSWLGYFDIKSGRHLAAYETYLRQYTQFFNEENADMMRTRLASLRRVIDDWYTADLRRRAVEWLEAKGVNPTVREIGEAGLLADMEWPDWVRLRGFLGAVESSPGARFPDSYDELTEISRKFIRKGWDRMPDNPASNNPTFQNYLVWPGQSPLTTQAGTKKIVDNAHFCTSELKVARSVFEQMAALAFQTRRFREQAAANQGPQPAAGQSPPGMVITDPNRTPPAETGPCPKGIQEIMKDPFTDHFEEPWGGRWSWDENACQLKSSTYPDLDRLYMKSPVF